MVVTLVPVVEIAGPCADDGSDSGPTPSTRESADYCASCCADSNTFGCLHVAAVSIVMRPRIVSRGAYSCLGSKNSQQHKESKKSGYQAVFHMSLNSLVSCYLVCRNGVTKVRNRTVANPALACELNAPR